ncbi:MAG: Capsular exopolysaccharide family [Blastococcus sp.]|jgi:capsular polysaccharide biosynthesis protein|nr:Capsular exopolysaccharide family [Blastococcus sp.]
MEFSEYLAAIRRYWTTCVGILAACLLLAALALQVLPRTYSATAQVFVSASPSIPNSAQYVNQRVKSYPDVVVSAPVLRPVIEELGLTEPFASLRGRVSADVPADTSQVRVRVTGTDPEEAAAIANAVAAQVTEVVPDLETPRSGDRPVTLTVSDPATAPTSPSSPVARNILGLGLAIGLFLGLAAAVVRSRISTTVHDPAGVRRAWGAEPVPDVLGRGRGRTPAGRPSRTLARRLELIAERQPVRVALVSPSAGQRPATAALAAEVAAELINRGVPASVSDELGPPPGPDTAGVALLVTVPDAPLGFWRQVAELCAGVVVVVPQDAVDETELCELRLLLEATGAQPLAVVLVPPAGRQAVRAATSTATGTVQLPPAGARPVPPIPGRPAGADRLPPLRT